MLSFLKELRDNAGTKLKRFNNRTFKEGSMAVCALVSAADGSIDPEEKTKVAGLIKSNDLLQVFDASELRDLFLDYCKRAEDEFDRLELLNLVRKLKGDEAAADTCLKVALIIANADGVFDDDEKRTVKDICGVLGLNASDYGV